MSNESTSFKPESVHDLFIEITKRPHPSANQKGVKGNEDPLRQFVVEQAEALGITGKNIFYDEKATEPGKRVIALHRPGKGKYKDKAPVIMQAHMDMVYNPADMDFPLQVIVDPSKEKRWLKAKDKSGDNSTLGADDGIGVATALAILKDKDLEEYPLECLFTVQEETGMQGAKECDLTKMPLKGDKLLNLDSEMLDIIIYGSAGGCGTTYKGEIMHRDSPGCDDKYVTRKLSISGLHGGHSGVDINKGRLNAIKVLTQILIRLNKRITNIEPADDNNGDQKTDQEEFIGSYDFLINNMKRTDVHKDNAIPAAAEALIALPKEQAAGFEKNFNTYCEALKELYKSEEPGFTYKIEDENCRPLDEKSTDALLCILNLIPHGVIKMIPDIPNLVETSTNLYDVIMKEGSVTIGSSNRSSDDPSLQALNKIQKNIGDCFNYEVETGLDSYPSWPPNPKSALLAKAEEVYKKVFGQYEATSIHAGLECGVLVEKFKEELGIKLEAVAIGPTINDPHTPKESLQVETPEGTQTIQQFYNAVSGIIKEVFDEA